MSYQSLYRRYRPSTFSQVVGQRHVVTALKNAISEDRVGHAYLFSGPRGTGKTTSARLLGKALNCTNLSDESEPCNQCESCESFLNGTSYDLHELDAASNNGVENVRDLINKVALGSPGRAKVYILDEVHMLTSGAENALLKTLEEPPDHVTFVLCTTEPHKVVPTIRSRTQHYEFELLPAEDLVRHVKWVAADANLDVSDDMVDYVIRAGGGSARDTLSALDQVVAAGGIPRDDDTVGTILSGLAAGDSGAVILGVSEALRSGRDPRVIGETLLARLREAFLVSMDAPLDQLSEAQVSQARVVSDSMGPASITRALETLGTALVEMRQAPDPRVDIEVALLRLSRPELDTDMAAVLERLERLESGGVTAAPAAAPAPQPAPAEATGAAVADRPAASPAPAPAPQASAPEPPASQQASAPPAAEAPAGEGPAAAARAMLANKRRDAEAGAAPAAAGAAAAAAGDRPTLGARRRQQAQDGTAAAADSAPAQPVPAEPQTGPPPEPQAEAPAPQPQAPAPQHEAQAPQQPATPPPAADRTAQQAAPTEQAEAPQQAAVPASATPAPAPAGAVDEATLMAKWPDILSGMGGRARSRFSGGSIVGVQGSTITFGLPNDIHRERCRECMDEVKAAVTEALGSPVELDLIVETDAPPPARSAPSAAAAPPAQPEAEEVIDLTALTDASEKEADGIDSLKSAFPGAELVDPGTP